MDFYYGLPITRTLSFMTELTGISIVTAIIELFAYIFLISCFSAGLALTFRKAGDRPIKAVIPVYNIYSMFKIVWSQKAFFVWFIPTAVLVGLSRIVSNATALLVILCMLALLITVFFHIVLCDRISRAFNEEIGMMIGLILLMPIYIMLIGNSPKEFHGVTEREKEPRKTKKPKEKKTKEPKLTREEKKALKKQNQEEAKHEAMKKREKTESEKGKDFTNVKKSRKERKAEKKRFDREAHGDGTSEADYYEERAFDADGNIVTPTYVLSDKEKHILANLKREKASGNFDREITEAERQALEKLRHIRSIGM